jgi:hypothetical protein
MRAAIRVNEAVLSSEVTIFTGSAKWARGAHFP